MGLTFGAIALAVVAGVAVGGADRSPSVAGLPRAMGEPECAPGEGYGHQEIDYRYGAGSPTARGALDSALPGHMDPADLSSRAVRVGDEVVWEFTLERPDGSLEALAVGTHRPDSGWLVSTVYTCFA